MKEFFIIIGLQYQQLREIINGFKDEINLLKKELKKKRNKRIRHKSTRYLKERIKYLQNCIQKRNYTLKMISKEDTSEGMEERRHLLKHDLSIETTLSKIIFNRIYFKIKGQISSIADKSHLYLDLSKPENVKLIKALRGLRIPN